MMWSSPYPDVEIPDLTLPEMVLQAARTLGDKPALIDSVTGTITTYQQLLHDVDRCASGLYRSGIRQGDVVAVYAPNSREYATILYGAARVGAVTTTVNYLYTPGELRMQLLQTDAVLLITTPDLVDRARGAIAGTHVHEIITVIETPGYRSLGDMLSTDASAPIVDIDPVRDVVALPCSSGTTGLSKPVMLTHRNLVANIAQFDSFKLATESDVVLGVLPFYHIYGMTVVLHGSLYAGATVVTMPRFDFAEMLKIIQRYGITYMNLVPPIILALVKHPMVDEYDLSSVRRIFSGAAPLDGDTAAAASTRLGSLVSQGYGLTETSPVTHVNLHGRPEGSAGQPIPNTECRIVDPATGRDLAAGDPGEVLIRGPQVMLGYLNYSAATAEAVDPDGWLRTGDLGICDAGGNLVIVDRIKELIKYKGFQVAPAELEAVLLVHPAVADCAVIRVPDPAAGEIPKGFVVLKEPVAAEELLAFVAERVAPFKKIRQIEVVDSIPRSNAGKILRRVLMDRERDRARVAASSSLSATP